MPKQGKRYRADKAKATQDAVPLVEAVNRVKAFKPAQFDQTIEIVMHLGIDPKQVNPDMDDASAENLAALAALGQETAETHGEELARIARRLVDAR